MADEPLRQNLGLSKMAVACYRDLDKNGATTVTELAKRLGKPRTGLYRVLKKLEQQGFLMSLKTTEQPTYFDTRPLDETLKLYLAYQNDLVKTLLEELNVPIG